MTVQSEYQLENELISQLKQLGYATVTIKDERQLLSNLKTQVERANGLAPLSETEWKQVISFLNTGTVFERAKNLRDLFPVKFDDGTSKHLFFLSDDPSKNIYQVTNQITIDHRDYNGRTSRFDVTLLVNGLPLVQIELKKRGMEIAEAFNQTQRYIREAYWAGQGLFGFIQLFVISNGANTRYYSNGTTGIEFAFPWADVHNKHINEIVDFAEAFLNQQHLTQMLTQYMVLLETTKSLMVLRPYQIYAVQKIVEHVQNSNQNGYIWHTTGSGKTLTSFKASQIIMQMPDVEKVLFVVDRNDLDTQTSREFNAFKAESVDSTDNTSTLVKQLDQRHDKLIVTTIQKLNRAISTDRYLESIDYLKNKKVVFIFDECHRSQFGETHQNIKKFFSNAQMFGFTGTPIFEKNSQSKAGLKLTTDYLFNECLHKYVIVDAIRDRNVLQFQIDYRGKYTAKGMATNESYEEDVEGIDTKELYDNPQRLEMIARYIVNIHDTKTRNREFTAMFCVSSVETLTQYYDIFEKVQAEKQIEDEAQGRIFKPLTIATIFSYAANEAVPTDDLTGLIHEEAADIPSQVNSSSRDKLDRYIANYNRQFKTNYNSGDQFYAYYRDIAQRVKNRQIDILIVVNMFLTGFDSKPLNTLYVDKNLKYHGLTQAYSRTNRILNEQKSQGNIVVFRNLKAATDEAITLFSNKDAIAEIIMEPYDEIKKDYEEAISKLFSLTPDYKSVDDLVTEEQQLEFIKAFRALMRLKNTISTFSDFDWSDLTMPEQSFEDYKSKYLDLHFKVKGDNQKEKVSILDDVDFELELIRKDEINVSYILKLLAELKETNEGEKEKKEKEIVDLLTGETNLRSKRTLIEKFINENLPEIEETENIPNEFDKFWGEEEKKAFNKLIEEENLSSEGTQKLIERYLFAEREPLRDDVLALIEGDKPSVLHRRKIGDKILSKIVGFVETFVNDITR